MDKKYTDLFIDFDDTLYDTHGNAVIALRETFEHFHLERWFPDPQVFYDAYWTANIDLWTRYSKGEITRDFLIVERFRRPLKASPSPSNRTSPPWEGLGEAFYLEMSDRFLDFCSTKPGVVDGGHELMDYLHSKGYRMHLCSNGFHEVQYKKLAVCGLRDYFQTIILSEDARANKPSKAFFDYALRQSGASPATTLMIGDNLQTDIIGAHNAGFDTILFNRWDIAPADIAEQAGSGVPTYTAATLHDIMEIL
jgi:putative hydrolase of the HAD superfamily